MLRTISRLFTRSLNVSFALSARVPDNFRKSGKSVSGGVLIKIIPNAGMRDGNRLSTVPLVEYSRIRGIAVYGTNCKTLSGENTCKRSCL